MADTGLAAEVAQLRAELGEMKSALGKQPAGLEPRQPPVNLTNPVNQWRSQGHVPFSDYSWFPEHDPRVTAAIMNGAGAAEISALLEQAARDIQARRDALQQPASPSELESRARRERAAGQADLDVWTAMRTMPPLQPGTQVSRSPGGQTTVIEPGAVSCSSGHARRDPADRYCGQCGGAFMNAGQAEELSVAELAARDAAAVARLYDLEQGAEPAKPPKQRARKAAGVA